MEAARCACGAEQSPCSRDATQEDMLCNTCRSLPKCVEARRDRAERARLDAERSSLSVSPEGMAELEQMLEDFGG